jgi:hypothetical protein
MATMNYGRKAGMLDLLLFLIISNGHWMVDQAYD